MIGKPDEGEVAAFFAGYLSLVPESDVLAVLEGQPGELTKLAASLTPEQETSRYAPGKWSVRQVFGHVTDAERVFGYRAFCISRKDPTELPGFDEKDYVENTDFGERALSELAAEFAAVREVNLMVLRPLEASRWRQLGHANGSDVSLRGLAYVMAGHVRHHLGVLRDRYSLGKAG